MLRIYEKMIPLEGSLEFVSEIKSIHNLKLKSKRVHRIKNILRMAKVFFIMYLSMFGEHLDERLGEEQIIRFMKVVEELLKGLGENETFKTKVNSLNSCEENWHNLLHRNKFPDGNAGKNISIAWKTVEYWMEANKNDSTFNSENSVSKARCHNQHWIQLINMKVLFFSNLNTIYHIVENKKKKM
jgi:hypothetical protein